MDNKVLSDVACGVFRLRKDDPHMTDSTIVDVHDDDYTTLTTVEVRNGTVVLHCISSWEQDEEEEESEEENSEDEEASGNKSEDHDDDSEEDEDDDSEDEKAGVEKTYTIASGNSVTVRALAVRLAPVGIETAEGTYQVQMMKSLN